MSEAPFHTIECCRVCGGRRLDRFLSLGVMPLANAFLDPSRLDAPEPRFPLDVARCEDCGLAQLGVVVAPEAMFASYVYASSASPPLLEHFAALAGDIAARYAPPGSLVVEIGSNDGVHLRPLAARGLRALGVEPAGNLARLANDAGLETWNEFFGSSVAGRIREAKGPAKVVVATNVLAHIDDLGDVLRALDILLWPDGVFVAEVPYLGDLIERVEYDTIYHEHLSYFALAPLARLFDRAGMELFDARRLEIHGGSIRLHVGRAGRHPVSAELASLRVAEEAWLFDPATYRDLTSRVERSRDDLRSLLLDLRSRGKRIAGHGASAKGNTLLNYCGIGPDLLAFIGDSTPFKQGLLTPGMHIPVRAESAITEDRPDYTLLLAWNYADAVVRRHAEYLASGGRFIHPIPSARVLS